MAKKFGPIDICCDAPPYTIVRGCRLVGIQAPEDVAWYRLDRYLSSRSGLAGSLETQDWRAILGMSGLGDRRCVCNGWLPELESVTFTLAGGGEMRYRIGQCRRCRTIFWEEMGPVPADRSAGV